MQVAACGIPSASLRAQGLVRPGQGAPCAPSFADSLCCSCPRAQPAGQNTATGPSPTHQQIPELKEETCENRHPNQVLGLVQDSYISKYLCENASMFYCSEFITAHSVVRNSQSSLPHKEGQQRSAFLSNLSALCRISIPLPLPELILSDSNCI